MPSGEARQRLGLLVTCQMRDQVVEAAHVRPCLHRPLDQGVDVFVHRRQGGGQAAGGVEGGLRAKLSTETLSQTIQQAGGAQYKAVLQAGRGALAQNGCRSLCSKVDLRQLSGVLYQCAQRELRPG